MKAAENGISKIRFPSTTKYISIKKSPEINIKEVGHDRRFKKSSPPVVFQIMSKYYFKKYYDVWKYFL